MGDGSSVPDSEMLISLSETLETSVSTLLGETVLETAAEDLKAISEKLEVINLQLARKNVVRRKALHCMCIMLGVSVAAIFAALILLDSQYLGWDLSHPETAVMETAVHAFGWLFVRSAPFIFAGAIAGIFLTRKKD